MTVTSYQPDETTGVDTMIYELQVSFNYGLNAQIWAGKMKAIGRKSGGAGSTHTLRPQRGHQAWPVANTRNG